MKTRLIPLALALVAGSLILNSCRKKDEDPPQPNPQGGKVKIEMTNKVGNQQIFLDSGWYLNENNDSFQVSIFNYYLSNFKLMGPDSAWYAEEESYHLIKHGVDSTYNFDMEDVPAGTYTSVSFMIGVDSARNTSGAQTGALDQTHGMFWDWNTGYIMMKFEGTSPSAPNNKVTLHPGGFSGANNTVREVTLQLPQPITVDDNTPHIHIAADLLELFKSPHTIDFSQMHTVMHSGPNAARLADNYENMFSVIMVE